MKAKQIARKLTARQVAYEKDHSEGNRKYPGSYRRPGSLKNKG